MITIDKRGIKHITGKGFRLVHDDKKVVALIEGTERTVTSANYICFEGDTIKKVDDEIKEKELIELPNEISEETFKEGLK